MDSKKQLVFSFIEFLNTCVEDGTIKSEDAESLEVATQCIGEVFGVDVNDAKQKEELSIKPTTLLQIFNVFVKTQKKSQKPATENIEKSTLTEEEKKKKAEEFKGLGNTKLTEKNYSEAIELYTKAIQLVDNNAVYYSNRAAAHSQFGDQDNAIADAIKATEINPSYSKAYSRLGHAYYCKNSFDEAVEAYTKALELDPNNSNVKSALENSKARSGKKDESRSVSESAPPADPFANLANMAAGLGGNGGGNPLAGMDLGSLMNNPAIMNMAQQFMKSGAYDEMMKDPSKMMDMAQNFMGNQDSSNGENPLASLMNDPKVAKMAEQFKNGNFGNPPKKE